MANEDQLKILKQGAATWNTWRRNHPYEILDLRGADLSGAHLSGAYLREVDLNRVVLIEADLSGADLIKADLSGANLVGAYLRGANLIKTDLRGTDFSGANLSRVILSRANLSGAILNEARFGSTILADVDLSSARGLERVVHTGPSSIGVDTLYRSHGTIPEVFLRGVGLPETFIQYLQSLIEQPFPFYSCFISYSHNDQSFAGRLHDALQGRGVRCWLDEKQLLPGDYIHAGIDQAIRTYDKILLCCSKASLTSWWVDEEINKTLEEERQLWYGRKERVLKLIPLDLDGYLFSHEYTDPKASQIRSRLAGKFVGWQRSHKKFEQQLERVVKALRADVAARGLPPQPKL